MIKEIDKEKACSLLRPYFINYKPGDPFEKVLVYEEENIKAIISYSIIYERAEINYIVTFPPYRGQGLASILLEKAMEDMLDNHCQVVTLEVDVTNKAAIKLYQKNGFKIETTRKNYYESKDAYLMSKEVEVIW